MATMQSKPRLLLHVEDVETGEFLHGQLSGGDFGVDRVFTRRNAIEKLQGEDFPLYIAPAGWAKGQDPVLDEVIEARRVLAMPADGLAKHPEPRMLLPLMRRYVERQRSLDALLSRILYHQAGLDVRDAKLRYPLDVPVHFEFWRTGMGKGRTLNLSSSGFYVALDASEALPVPREEFLFRIDAPESRFGPLSGTARVRWLCDGSRERTPPRGPFRSRIGFGAEILVPMAEEEAA